SVFKAYTQSKHKFINLLTQNLFIEESKRIESEQLLSGLYGTGLAFSLLGIFNGSKPENCFLIILPTEKEAADLYHDLTNLLG
ncbi:MAG: hypothetical protein MPK62_15635, partial [Alphaproteobacteria bacterium]|nr:hypothetical protein [Alphaproteobacteria bacterium]